MATVHIPGAEAARGFGSLILRAKAGDTVLIENAATPIAILQDPNAPRRFIEGSIALLPEDFKATWT